MADFIHGIDVSKYQGSIDWPAVAAAGQSFAFIRLGYINRDGSITIDETYNANMRGAIDAGLQVGVYLYSYLRGEDAARIAANKAMELVAPYGLTMPIVLDYEHAALYQTYSKETNVAICNAFLSTIAAGGYIPVIYTYYSFATNWLPLDSVPYTRWLANYTGRIGIDNVDIWQYSSSGSVAGIAGRVDMNRAYNNWWSMNPNQSQSNDPTWEPLTDKILEAFGTKKCEYFDSCDVDDVSGALISGETYPATALMSGILGGYSWAKVIVNGEEKFVALLDDRCRIADAPGCDCKTEIAALEAEQLRLSAELDLIKHERDTLAATLEAIRVILEE